MSHADLAGFKVSPGPLPSVWVTVDKCQGQDPNGPCL
jgi:hypothetical protein